MASNENGHGEEEQSSESADGRTNLSRRRWLEISGVAGAGIFAGCGGDESGTPAGDTPAETTAAGDGDGDGDMDGGDGDGGATATDTPTATTTAGDGDGGDGDGGDGEATETETPSEDLPMVEGQTFTTSMTANPANIIYPSTMKTGISSMLDGWEGARFLRPFLYDNGLWGPWSTLGIDFGGKHHTLIEDVSIEPDEISWTFKEGATHANGNQITGKDSVTGLLHWARQSWTWSSYKDGTATKKKAITGDASNKRLQNEGGKWNAPLMAINDYEADGRTAKWKSDGYFTEDIITSKRWMWTYITGVIAGFSGHWYDTSVEPWKSWAEETLAQWEPLKNGATEFKDNPAEVGQDAIGRYGVAKGFENLGVVDSADDAVLDPDSDVGNPIPSEQHDAVAEWMRDPENMKTFTNGAFMVKEWNGTQSIVFEKNPEYFFADRVNFEEVEIVSRPEERANWAAVKADEYDLYNRGTVPPSTASSFPDTIEEKLARADAGVTMRLNLHPDGVFGDVRVRQAVMQLLNTGQIANAVHKSLQQGITTPGGHLWRADETLGEEWIDENLHDYSADSSLATDLLEDAGWSRQGGVWVDDEGEEVSLTIPTTSGTPDYEVSISQQLNNFGIDTSIATMNQETFKEGWRAGDFDMWPAENFATGFRTAEWTYMARDGAQVNSNIGIFEQEDIEAAVQAINEGSEEEVTIEDNPSLNPQREEHLDIPVPPVGEWDKKTEGLQQQKVWRDAVISTEEGLRKVRERNWVVNWYLPYLPVTRAFSHMFIDSAHYIWPEDETWEKQGIGLGGGYPPAALLGTGRVQADPDNTE